MDEQSKVEQELSEERLGEISGGCSACGTDKAHITRYTRRKDDLRAQSQAAYDRGNYGVSRMYSLAADRVSNQIIAAQERIVGRGHGHLLDRPYVPDLNLPRPAEGGGSGA
jgi:hypothetical protein